MRRPLETKVGEDSVEDTPLLATLLQLEGTRACVQPRCPSRHGIGCEFVDRRNRRCATAWCPAHRVVADGHIYCRRHAAVVNALPAAAGGELPPPPDLDDRAPALTSWIARTIDAGVRAAIATALAIDPGAVLSSAVVLTLAGPERRRTWEHEWHGRADTGDSLRVAVLVEEAGGGEVQMRIGDRRCAQLTPPWIGDRSVGPDDARRRAFSAALIDALDAQLRDRSTEDPA